MDSWSPAYFPGRAEGGRGKLGGGGGEMVVEYKYHTGTCLRSRVVQESRGFWFKCLSGIVLGLVNKKIYLCQR